MNDDWSDERKLMESMLKDAERLSGVVAAREAEAEAAQAARDAEEATRTCPWCGWLAPDVEALDIHEEDCQP